MAPVANNNSNNIRQTGTVPKTSSKNSVPQEVVAPTRRDLQQHLNNLVNWASATENTNLNAKPQNNRNPLNESACFDFDNSRFIPVRPTVRRNHLHEEFIESNIFGTNSANISNAAIGVVIPNSLSETSFNESQHILNSLSRNNESAMSRMPNGSPLQAPSPHNLPRLQTNVSLPPRANVEDKLSQIQEYIRITSSLLNSMQNDDSNKEERERLTNSLFGLRDSERKLTDILNTKYSSEPINSIQLDDIIEEELVRPQSVSSIHTLNSAPQSPTYEELCSKLDSSNRNLQNMKEQQNHLVRLQNAAKQQVIDLQNLKSQQTQNGYTQNGNIPNYETEEQVHDDVTSLMNRMKSLGNFIQNQNDLTNLFDGDSDEAATEQAMLQKKLQELSSKKNQMENLVSQLQNLNVQTNNRFEERERTPTRNGNFDHETTPTRIVPIENLGNRYQERGSTPTRIVPIENVSHSGGNRSYDREATPTRNVPIEYHRIVPIEILNNSSNRSNGHSIETENYESMESEEIKQEKEQVAEILTEKMSEINAMKDQLKRLKDMMETVKLIEMKSGENETNPEFNSRNVSPDRFNPVQPESEVNFSSNCSNKSSNQASSIRNVFNDTTAQEEESENVEQRLQALQAISQDLREQAITLASQRGVYGKNELNSTNIQTKSSGSSERDQMILKAEQEVKKESFDVKIDNKHVKERAVSSCADPATPLLTSKSILSGSTRSLNLPPSMANLPDRNYRKTSQDNSQTSNPIQPGNSNQFDYNSSPFNFGGYGQNYHHIRPQSPPHCGENSHCSYFHHQNHSVELNSHQECMQTQKMLLTTICKCNELIYNQQKEIQGLNNTVHMLQECLINQNNQRADAVNMRAESVPPPVNCNNDMQQSLYYMRAQSEQPLINMNPIKVPIHNHYQNPMQTPMSPLRHPNHIQRNLPPPVPNNNNQNSNNRVYRNTTHSWPNASIQSQNSVEHNIYQNSDDIPTSTGQQQTIFPFYSNQNDSFQEENSHPLNNNPILYATPNQTYQPIFMHHNNNTSNNNNNNKILQPTQNMPSTTTTATANSAFNTSGPSTLNNQVPPGNRNNNYWDNFRSYSRQNLLSGNHSKSKESVASLSSNNFIQNVNQERTFNTTRNHQSTMINNFPNYFRNQTSQLSQLNGDELLNVENNQQNQNIVTNNFNNTEIDQEMNLGFLEFHTNPINLGVNEFNTKSKTLPKGNGAIKKQRSRQDGQLFDNIESDLNLSSAMARHSKSSFKVFEALKENVYLEVSALIAANESRPHFLIQLFRDLQLISSDPLRHRALHSIQELYNRNFEGNIQEGSSSQSIQDNIESSLNQPEQSSRNNEQSTGQFSIDDFQLFRSIMRDVTTYIRTIEIINNAVVQQVLNITYSHLNTTNDSNNYFLDQEQFLKHLGSSNRNNKDEFISTFGNYLNNIFMKTFLDENDRNDEEEIIPIVDQKTVTILQSENIAVNEDLAEADQRCNEQNYSEEIFSSNVGDMGEGAASVEVISIRAMNDESELTFLDRLGILEADGNDDGDDEQEN